MTEAPAYGVPCVTGGQVVPPHRNPSRGSRRPGVIERSASWAALGRRKVSAEELRSTDQVFVSATSGIELQCQRSMAEVWRRPTWTGAKRLRETDECKGRMEWDAEFSDHLAGMSAGRS